MILKKGQKKANSEGWIHSAKQCLWAKSARCRHAWSHANTHACMHTQAPAHAYTKLTPNINTVGANDKAKLWFMVPQLQNICYISVDRKTKVASVLTIQLLKTAALCVIFNHTGLHTACLNPLNDKEKCWFLADFMLNMSKESAVCSLPDYCNEIVFDRTG